MLHINVVKRPKSSSLLIYCFICILDTGLHTIENKHKTKAITIVAMIFITSLGVFVVMMTSVLDYWPHAEQGKWTLHMLQCTNSLYDGHMFTGLTTQTLRLKSVGGFHTLVLASQQL